MYYITWMNHVFTSAFRTNINTRRKHVVLIAWEAWQVGLEQLYLLDETTPHSHGYSTANHYALANTCTYQSQMKMKPCLVDYTIMLTVDRGWMHICILCKRSILIQVIIIADWISLSYWARHESKTIRMSWNIQEAQYDLIVVVIW